MSFMWQLMLPSIYLCAAKLCKLGGEAEYDLHILSQAIASVKLNWELRLIPEDVILIGPTPIKVLVHQSHVKLP